MIAAIFYLVIRLRQIKKAHCNPKITAGPTEQGHFASTAPHVKPLALPSMGALQ